MQEAATSAESKRTADGLGRKAEFSVPRLQIPTMQSVSQSNASRWDQEPIHEKWRKGIYVLRLSNAGDRQKGFRKVS